MADLYHNQSQDLLAEYLSVRRHVMVPFNRLVTLCSLRESQGRKEMSPYLMVAYVLPFLAPVFRLNDISGHQWIGTVLFFWPGRVVLRRESFSVYHQHSNPDESMHPKYTIERNKTYRLRLVNTGSFASIRFSVDNHSLTLIEADGTLLAPTEVAGVTIAVAQRYSVLLYANQTSSPNGTYWMRATVQSDMFTYDQPGQNLDIRGVIRYGVFPAQQHSF